MSTKDSSLIQTRNRFFCTRLKIKNGCPSADNGTLMASINQTLTNGTKLEFDQFAFVSNASLVDSGIVDSQPRPIVAQFRTKIFD